MFAKDADIRGETMLVFQIKPLKHDPQPQIAYQMPEEKIVPRKSGLGPQEGWVRAGIEIKNGHLSIHSDSPVFSFIIDGNRTGQYSDIRYNLASGTYSGLRGSGWMEQPGAQAVCYNLQVKKGMVSGEGALISVGAKNGRPALIVTQSPSKDPKSPEEYANAYLVYGGSQPATSGSQPAFEKTIIYEGPAEQGESKAQVNRYPNGRLATEKLRIEIRDAHAVSIELLEGAKKLEPIPTRTETPEKVLEYRTPAPEAEYTQGPANVSKYAAQAIQRQGPRFGRYEEVRIPLRISDPDHATATISLAGGEVRGVHIQKDGDGLRIGGGALNTPGEYRYAVNDNGRITRGSFDIMA